MSHGQFIWPSNRVVHSSTGWAAAVQQLLLTSVLKPPPPPLPPLHALPHLTLNTLAGLAHALSSMAKGCPLAICNCHYYSPLLQTCHLVKL
jgi:hypothetical protein